MTFQSLSWGLLIRRTSCCHKQGIESNQHGKQELNTSVISEGIKSRIWEIYPGKKSDMAFLLVTLDMSAMERIVGVWLEHVMASIVTNSFHKKMMLKIIRESTDGTIGEQATSLKWSMQISHVHWAYDYLGPLFSQQFILKIDCCQIHSVTNIKFYPIVKD